MLNIIFSLPIVSKISLKYVILGTTGTWKLVSKGEKKVSGSYLNKCIVFGLSVEVWFLQDENY